MILTAKDVRQRLLIEERLTPYVEDSSRVCEQPAASLISRNRFDIAVKLAYLDAKDDCPEFARGMYGEHLRAFGLGQYAEPEKPHKNSLEAFIEDFESIYNSLACDGFDKEKSIVPVARNASILNGAHRVASSIRLGLHVPTIELDVSARDYDYRFFKRRGLSWNSLMASIEALFRYNNEMRIGLIWPRAANKTSKAAEGILATSYLVEDFYLSPAELVGIVRQVYQGEMWLGNPGNSYAGARAKAEGCFEKGQPLRLFAFDASSLGDLHELKKKIRDWVGVGKHCIHLGDGVHDSLPIARALCNPNFLQFVRAENSSRYREKDEQIALLAKSAAQSGVVLERACLGSGAVLQLLGARCSADMDLFLADDAPPDVNALHADGIDVSSGKIDYLDSGVKNLVFNPANYFYYNGVKVMALPVLRSFYESRFSTLKDPKDRRTLELMPGARGFDGSRLPRLSAQLYFWRQRAQKGVRRMIVTIIKKAGCYSYLRSKLKK